MTRKIPTSLPHIVTRPVAARTPGSRLLALVGLAAAALGASLACAGSTQAQNQPDPSRSDRVIELFTCKDVMRQPNTSREIAIAFLHGYLLGKSGNSKFNVEVLESQTNAFIEQCLDNPQSRAVDVMTKLRG
jgi:HdeA/HdeB family